MKSYLELLELDDAALAQEGWQRNAYRGITRIASAAAIKQVANKERWKEAIDLNKTGCGGCGGKRTIGVASMIGALIGGKATPDTAAQRLAICEACQYTDTTSERLYRVIDGKVYCGVPRLADVTKIFRDESKIGCGCELHDKVQWRKASCPNNRWGEEEEAVKPNQTASPVQALPSKVSPAGTHSPL